MDANLYQISRPNGVVPTYTVNAVGWLTDLTHGGSEADLAIYHYAYEPVGNRWQAVETVYAPHVVYLPVVLNLGAGTQALGLNETLPEAANQGWIMLMSIMVFDVHHRLQMPSN